MIPGFVGARSVKWIDRIVVTRKECDGMHQIGIAYKQLGPNKKSLGAVSKQYIESMPPIDSVPVLSAITSHENGQVVQPGAPIHLQGYAYSGVGMAIIRVDVSVDGGETWDQAQIERADDTQGIRSNRAWAWIQWRMSTKIPEKAEGTLKIMCKAVDDQYNQQPHAQAPIWNLRGILNTAWGTCECKVNKDGLDIGPEAKSGDGSIENVGIRMSGTFQRGSNQRFDTKEAADLHYKFFYDPNRHLED
jgi:sulfite oxidase